MSEDILKDSWVPEGPVSKKIKDRIKKQLVIKNLCIFTLC